MNDPHAHFVRCPARGCHRLLMPSIIVALAIACVGCEREERSLHARASQAMTVDSISVLQARINARQAAPSLTRHDENNSYAIAQGKQLFNVYNCTGCHAQGGGGSGPAL